MPNYVRQAIAFRAADLVETTTVTSKGQITIPSRLRKELQITEGEITNLDNLSFGSNPTK
jgi:AbrB family looped-hinge helix DNA binding protein